MHGGQFLLIAGELGHAWVEAAEKIAAERGLPLRATRVGVLGSDYVDVRCGWLKHRGISADGAVLVRPDRYVAFRAHGAVDDPTRTLRHALDHILVTPGQQLIMRTTDGVRR